MTNYILFVITLILFFILMELKCIREEIKENKEIN